MKGKFQAIQAFMTIMRTITQANGYYHDLSARVYPTLLVPESLPFQPTATERWAYLCVPLVEDDAVYERAGTMQTRSWTLRAWGFVGEQETDRALTTEVEDLSKLEDDIVRALLPTPPTPRNLMGSVDGYELARCNSHAGWLAKPERTARYGELEFSLRVLQSIQASNLGPGGV